MTATATLNGHAPAAAPATGAHPAPKPEAPACGVMPAPWRIFADKADPCRAEVCTPTSLAGDVAARMNAARPLECHQWAAVGAPAPCGCKDKPNHLHWRMVAGPIPGLDPGAAEVVALKARLAAVEAERDEAMAVCRALDEIDCCAGYSLGDAEYPKFWDAQERARAILAARRDAPRPAWPADPGGPVS